MNMISIDLTCILSDINGIRYSSIQIWFAICIDHFHVGCCIHYIHIDSDPGTLFPTSSYLGCEGVGGFYLFCYLVDGKY